jgi:hypothetical protein
MALTFYQEMSSVVNRDDSPALAAFINEDKSRLARETSSGPCLQYAAQQGKLNAVKCLVELGADVNRRGGIIERTALEEAIYEGHTDVVEFLLAHGSSFDLSVPNHNPYFIALHGNHIEVIKFLLNRGVDTHIVYRGTSGKLKNAISFARDLAKHEIENVLVAAGCRMPVEGLDVAVNEAEVQALLSAEQTEEDNFEDIAGAVSAATDEQEIVTFVSHRFGKTEPVALRELLPVFPDVGLAIHVIEGSRQHPFVTLYTTGMSSRAMLVPPEQSEFQYAELMLHLPSTWPRLRDANATDLAALWPIAALRRIAYHPHCAGTWFGDCHTVSTADPPEPLGPNTRLSSALLVADKLKPLKSSTGKTIRFFTVYLLYPEEMALVAKQGVGELLRRFQENRVTPLVDVNRPNVALGV